MWIDIDGVVHITDDPRGLPPSGEVETIHYSEKGEGTSRTVLHTVYAEGRTGEENLIDNSSDGASPAKDPNRAAESRKLEQARDEYEQAKELVEKRRRNNARQSSKRSRDAYKHALEELAAKREQVRALQSEN